jgi:hypothetical protein
MLTILIPTKDRPYLAMRAIECVINQNQWSKKISLVVSDNSEIKNNRKILSNFCKGKNLIYHETPKVLPMTKHWNWAFELIIDLNKYITILTDRMILKNNIFDEIFDILKETSVKILSYPNDSIGSLQTILGRIYFAKLQTTSGKLKTFSSDYLLKCASECILPMALPRMLNSIVCVKVVKNKKKKFGNFFDSMAPDFNMCWSLLSMEKNIYYLDKSILISAGAQFSNGATSDSGNSFASKSFSKLSVTKKGFFMTPLPNIMQGVNSILHEYENIKKINNNLPEPDFHQWYGRIAQSLKSQKIDKFKLDIEKLFKSDCWRWSDGDFANEESKNFYKRLIKFKNLFFTGNLFLSEEKAIKKIVSSYRFGPYLKKRTYF